MPALHSHRASSRAFQPLKLPQQGLRQHPSARRVSGTARFQVGAWQDTRAVPAPHSHARSVRLQAKADACMCSREAAQRQRAGRPGAQPETRRAWRRRLRLCSAARCRAGLGSYAGAGRHAPRRVGEKSVSPWRLLCDLLHHRGEQIALFQAHTVAYLGKCQPQAHHRNRTHFPCTDTKA